MKALKTIPQIDTPPRKAQVKVKQNCDGQNDPQNVEFPVRSVCHEQCYGQNDQPTKGDNTAKCSTQTQAKDAANGQDAEADQRDFGPVEIRRFRLVLIG